MVSSKNREGIIKVIVCSGRLSITDKSFCDSMNWPRKQKAPAGALKHKLVLDGYHFCEVEQHLFVLHGIVWYGVTLELCGTELHLNDHDLNGT